MSSPFIASLAVGLLLFILGTGFSHAQSENVIGGVGLGLKPTADGRVIIDRVAPNGPAAQAGIQPGDWLVRVMKRVDHPRMGTLPDFGNFYEYDRYQAVGEMMPYAKAVSAKSHDFDAAGNETGIDYKRMMQIVLRAKFRSWVGIEYEGTVLPEPDGVMATLRLLQRMQTELA